MNNQLLLDCGIPAVGLALAVVGLIAARIMSWRFHKKFPDALDLSKSGKAALAGRNTKTTRGLVASVDEEALNKTRQMSERIDELQQSVATLERRQGLEEAERRAGMFSVFGTADLAHLLASLRDELSMRDPRIDDVVQQGDAEGLILLMKSWHVFQEVTVRKTSTELDLFKQEATKRSFKPALAVIHNLITMANGS